MAAGLYIIPYIYHNRRIQWHSKTVKNYDDNWMKQHDSNTFRLYWGQHRPVNSIQGHASIRHNQVTFVTRCTSLSLKSWDYIEVTVASSGLRGKTSCKLHQRAGGSARHPLTQVRHLVLIGHHPSNVQMGPVVCSHKLPEECCSCASSTRPEKRNGNMRTGIKCISLQYIQNWSRSILTQTML